MPREHEVITRRETEAAIVGGGEDADRQWGRGHDSGGCGGHRPQGRQPYPRFSDARPAASPGNSHGRGCWAVHDVRGPAPTTFW
jgi:hypothetical protein